MTKKTVKTKKNDPKKDPKRKEYYLALGEDEDDAEMLAASERGELSPVENFPEMKRMMEQAARNYMRKDKRVNIRLSNADVTRLKQRAEIEGLPYQTLIASVLHKYVNGTLKDVR